MPITKTELSDQTKENDQAAAGQVTLQAPARLSQSLLWQLQRDFFERKGAAAWGEHIVPSYITTNPFIAGAYAHLMRAWMRDWAAQLDPTEPLYLVELGSGTGRLGFSIVKQLAATAAASGLNVPFCYVLTDLAEKNVQFWQGHPALAPFLAAGQVDCARFDAARPQPLELIRSGQPLGAAPLKNPLVLIANYFFDGIPQDAFYVEAGQLWESRLALSPAEPGPDPGDPDLFKRLTLVYSRHRVTSEYYSDANLNRLLGDYQNQLDETALEFPIAALECIRFFADAAPAGLLLLTADKGYHLEPDLQGRKEPGYAVHGSFSMQVNYNALGRYFRLRGGDACVPDRPHPSLEILAFLLGEHPNAFAETYAAFHQAIELHGPDDWFHLTQAVEAHLGSFDLEQLLAYLRFSGWDSHIFYKCLPSLLEKARTAGEPLREELNTAVERLWENYYFIGEADDLPFDLGMLLARIGEHPRALVFFERSLQLYGPAPSTFYNQAVCHYRLGETGAAEECCLRALELNPGFELAEKLRSALRGQGPVPE